LLFVHLDQKDTDFRYMKAVLINIIFIIDFNSLAVSPVEPLFTKE